MKNNLLTCFCFLLFFNAKSQVKFCPQGAEWSYNFFLSGGGNPAWQQMLLEKVRYTHDSLIGSDSVKVLKHGWFYLECGQATGLTAIKQVGDTVFMRNYETNHNWEILYNFNVSVGDEWVTHIKINEYAPPSSMYTYTIHVDSIGSVNVNGFNLKRLFVRYNRLGLPSNFSSRIALTERFGTSNFMFNYYNNTVGGCDGDWFNRFLCYQDNEFGNKQFTTYPCDYSNPLGIKELQKLTGISLYPNPSNNNVSVQIQNSTGSKNYRVQILSIEGQRVLYFDKSTIENSSIKLDVSPLKNGIYFLQLFNNGTLIGQEKFVKE